MHQPETPSYSRGWHQCHQRDKRCAQKRVLQGWRKMKLKQQWLQNITRQTASLLFSYAFPWMLIIFHTIKQKDWDKRIAYACVCIFVVADSDMRVIGGFASCCALSDLPCVDFASLIDAAELLSGFISTSNVRIRPCALLLQPGAKTWFPIWELLIYHTLINHIDLG